jgi:hypothetical protein
MTDELKIEALPNDANSDQTATTAVDRGRGLDRDVPDTRFTMAQLGFVRFSDAPGYLGMDRNQINTGIRF